MKDRSRLDAALRENLRRRKIQIKARFEAARQLGEPAGETAKSGESPAPDDEIVQETKS